MTIPPEVSLAGNTDEATDSRMLLYGLLALLSQTRNEQVAEAERHATQQAQQRAAFQRDLLQDREGFLGVVAHELKTPVSVIKAYAELLEAQMSDEGLARPTREAMRQVVGHIVEQADLMSSLIEEILDVQRVQLGKLPLELSRVDLLALAENVAEEVQQMTRAHTVRVVASSPPPVVQVDRRRIRQVLVNLLENAVKYSTDGQIQVRVGAQEQGTPPGALVAIHDEGVGLEPADLDRIFNCFVQVADEPVQGRLGLGLGLYVARQIVRAHSCPLWAESPGKGHGSTFYLSLPLQVDVTP